MDIDITLMTLTNLLFIVYSFWFENSDNEIFSPEEVASIRDITLWDVIVNSTDIQPDEIQQKVGLPG